MPWRILPLTDAPEEAGTLLHDNLCPHVKRVLDRAMAGDLPELAGLVLMNSCDAMRRLADGWRAACPDDRLVFLDLPVTCDQPAIEHFAGELRDLAGTLEDWGGRPVDSEGLAASAGIYDEVVSELLRLEERAARGTFVGGRRALQELHNQSVTSPPAQFLGKLREIGAVNGPPPDTGMRVPLFLFGNVMPDPEAFGLLESCGARIVADDLCTGARQLIRHELEPAGNTFLALSRAILSRDPCARMLPGRQAESIAGRVLAQAEECGARGVIAYVMKFCDPYLARMPAVSRILKDADMPLLVLEGDCTLRSMGQHRTRIEAFVELLGGSPS